MVRTFHFIYYHKVQQLLSEDDTGNLLDALDQYGIEKVLHNRCANESDVAFRFNNPSDTTLATSNLFPNGFPTDFSILIVVRQLTIGKIQTPQTSGLCFCATPPNLLRRCVCKPHLSFLESGPVHNPPPLPLTAAAARYPKLLKLIAPRPLFC